MSHRKLKIEGQSFLAHVIYEALLINAWESLILTSTECCKESQLKYSMEKLIENLAQSSASTMRNA